MSDFDHEWFGMAAAGFRVDTAVDIHTGAATVLVCVVCRPDRRVGSWDDPVDLADVYRAARAHRADAGHGEGR